MCRSTFGCRRTRGAGGPRSSGPPRTGSAPRPSTNARAGRCRRTERPAVRACASGSRSPRAASRRRTRARASSADRSAGSRPPKRCVGLARRRLAQLARRRARDVGDDRVLVAADRAGRRGWSACRRRSCRRREPAGGHRGPGAGHEGRWSAPAPRSRTDGEPVGMATAQERPSASRRGPGARPRRADPPTSRAATTNPSKRSSTLAFQYSGVSLWTVIIVVPSRGQSSGP